MSKTRVQVLGLRELGEAMRELRADVAGRIARAGVAAGAKVIRDDARKRAPISDAPHQLGRRKGEIVQPGNLRANIVMKRQRQAKLTEQYAVAVRQGSGRAGKDAFYGRFVEFGTVKMAPQPFLRPAFESRKEDAAQALRKRIEARIKKAERGRR